MAHPTEAELRGLGEEILDLLVQKTIEEARSYSRATANMSLEDPETFPDPYDIKSQEIEAYVRHTYGFLPDTFARYAEPRPESFEDAIEQCVTAAMFLEPSLKDLEPAATGDLPREGREIWPNPSFTVAAAARYPTNAAERIEAVKGQVEDQCHVA